MVPEDAATAIFRALASHARPLRHKAQLLYVDEPE
jgi:hypothetical protein